MAMPEYFSYQRNETDGCVTIIGLKFDLDQKQLDPTKDLHIFADVLTLSNGTLSLPGKNILIRARKIISQDTTLDTSGATVVPEQVPHIDPPIAASGVKCSESGQPGKNGGATPETLGAKGNKAGSINIFAGEIAGKLTLAAAGGKGQKGQDGQHGGNGQPGCNGKDAEIQYLEHPTEIRVIQGTKGGDGGNGGNGGDAGKSGDGGDAGDISVLTLNALAPGQITINNSGGSPGDAAAPGGGGTGFGAGTGGRLAKQRYTHFGEEWYISYDRAQSGSPGHNGSTGKAAPPAQQGKVGAKSIESVKSPEQVVLYDKFLLSQYLITMHQAELAYLAQDFADALTLYTWLKTMTYTPPKATDTLAPEFAALNQSVQSLIRQIGLGLDFFGNPLNHVPLVSLGYYQQAIPVLLSLGRDIENIYTQYTEWVKDQKKQYRAFDDSIAKGKQVLERFQKGIDQSKDDLAQTNTAIIQLTAEQENQYRVVLAAEETFKHAVEEKSKCNFEDVLKFLGCIISIAADGFDIFDAIKNIRGLAKGLEVESHIMQEVRTISEQIDDMRDNFKAIKDLNRPGAPDTAKLIMEQEKFEKALEPYMDMPEAQDYKKQVDDYIAVVQSRNAKLLSYTSTLAAIANYNAKLIQKQKEIDRILSDEASIADPTLSPYRTFVQGLYQDFKLMCLKYLYQENQAYKYWSLQAHPFSVADTTFAELDNFHGDIQGKIIDYINMVFSPHQPFKTVNLVTSADDPDRAKQFAQFKDRGTMTFQIPTDAGNYLGWSDIMATGFTVYLPGAVTSAPNNRLYVQLWHQGRAVMFDQKGGRHDFSHEQVLSVYQYEMQKDPSGQFVPVGVAGGILGGDARIALSPFSAWTLTVPEKFNPGMSLKNVERIEFTLSGYALPSLAKNAHAG